MTGLKVAFVLTLSYLRSAQDEYYFPSELFLRFSDVRRAVNSRF